MLINADNPTRLDSSRSLCAARDAPGWATQRWIKGVAVPVTTLACADRPSRRTGLHQEKIDVEGFEYKRPAGPHDAVKALVIEFTRQSARCSLCLHRTRITLVL